MRNKIILIAVAIVMIAGLFVYIGYNAYSSIQINNTETIKEECTTVYYIQEDLSSYFVGYEGCFVLYDQENNTYTIYNKEKSTKRLPPNSSFKIYNSLIGLESGVVEDANTLFKWDGTKHSIVSWNSDHTLASAFANSVVWYYKELASRVGEKTMQKYIDKIGYGNKDISGGINKFWLQSSLEISPMEQVELLKQMYAYELPFSKRNIDIVKKIMAISSENGTTLRGKTGTGMKANNAVNGWFVGCVEKGSKVYFFATNVEGQSNADGKKAQEITKKILKEKGILQ